MFNDFTHSDVVISKLAIFRQKYYNYFEIGENEMLKAAPLDCPYGPNT